MQISVTPEPDTPLAPGLSHGSPTFFQYEVVDGMKVVDGKGVVDGTGATGVDATVVAGVGLAFGVVAGTETNG